VTQTTEVIIATAHDGGREAQPDHLAVEEPLEIRLGYRGTDRWRTQSVSITMRTPGHDADLAAGFLFAEGIVRTPSQIAQITVGGAARNVLRVDLHPDARVDLKRMERHFYTSSSCGVCGKTSLDALSTAGCSPLPDSGARFQADMIHQLPALLRQSQPAFERTGGLHAAALFDRDGRLLSLREDVGRHNAVDKVIGAEFLAGRVPLSERLMVVSGRAGFELMQKALVAGIPVLAAVGAPSSLAVELGQEFDITLIGFLKAERLNIYSAAWRIT